jgi:hypothetical protein
VASSVQDKAGASPDQKQERSTKKDESGDQESEAVGDAVPWKGVCKYVQNIITCVGFVNDFVVVLIDGLCDVDLSLCNTN